MTAIARVRYYRTSEEAHREWSKLGFEGLRLDQALSGVVFVMVEGDISYLTELQGAAEALDVVTSLARVAARRPRLLLYGSLSELKELGMKSSTMVKHAVDGFFSIRSPSIAVPAGWLDFDRTRVMGILNVTPDSFSDGGRFVNKDKAMRRAMQLVEEGADIIDIGGESTRPGAKEVPLEQEIKRVVPLVEELSPLLKVPISVDTRKAEVARAAMEAGASIVNDVSGLTDPNMVQMVADTGAPVVLMHTLGDPTIMQKIVNTDTYEDVVGDIMWTLEERIGQAAAHGVLKEQVILDPGIGFGKLPQNNAEILHRLREFRSLGCPLLVGASRKSFISRLTGGAPPEQRLGGSLGAAALAMLNGADIIRVHDVKETAQLVRIINAIESIEQ